MLRWSGFRRVRSSGVTEASDMFKKGHSHACYFQTVRARFSLPDVPAGNFLEEPRRRAKRLALITGVSGEEGAYLAE